MDVVLQGLVVLYAVAGGGSIAIQGFRRLGKAGLVALLPLLASGVAIAGMRHSISPASVPVESFVAMLGGFCLAIVVATRGDIERFVDPEALPERLRTGDANDALLVQTRAIGIWFVLMSPLAVAFFMN